MGYRQYFILFTLCLVQILPLSSGQASTVPPAKDGPVIINTTTTATVDKPVPENRSSKDTVPAISTTSTTSGSSSTSVPSGISAATPGGSSVSSDTKSNTNYNIADIKPSYVPPANTQTQANSQNGVPAGNTLQYITGSVGPDSVPANPDVKSLPKTGSVSTVNQAIPESSSSKTVSYSNHNVQTSEQVKLPSTSAYNVPATSVETQIKTISSGVNSGTASTTFTNLQTSQSTTSGSNISYGNLPGTVGTKDIGTKSVESQVNVPATSNKVTDQYSYQSPEIKILQNSASNAVTTNKGIGNTNSVESANIKSSIPLIQDYTKSTGIAADTKPKETVDTKASSSENAKIQSSVPSSSIQNSLSTADSIGTSSNYKSTKLSSTGYSGKESTEVTVSNKNEKEAVMIAKTLPEKMESVKALYVGGHSFPLPSDPEKGKKPAKPSIEEILSHSIANSKGDSIKVTTNEKNTASSSSVATSVSSTLRKPSKQVQKAGTVSSKTSSTSDDDTFTDKPSLTGNRNTNKSKQKNSVRNNKVPKASAGISAAPSSAKRGNRKNTNKNNAAVITKNANNKKPSTSITNSAASKKTQASNSKVTGKRAANAQTKIPKGGLKKSIEFTEMATVSPSSDVFVKDSKKTRQSRKEITSVREEEKVEVGQEEEEDEDDVEEVVTTTTAAPRRPARRRPSMRFPVFGFPFRRNRRFRSIE